MDFSEEKPTEKYLAVVLVLLIAIIFFITNFVLLPNPVGNFFHTFIG